MSNKRCPRCDSQSFYKMRNGIISGDKHVFVRGLGLLTPRTDRMTYLCADCGYYENYIIDKDILLGVTRKWEKV
jgi:DNA-directed RNA polymerase subunit RPC12/RpoP